VHRALSAMRRRRLWNTVGALLLLEPEARDEGPDAALERGRHLARLSRALEKLSSQQAAAFTLRYLEGLDFDAVAEALGCARGTARIHVQRAVRRLKDEDALEDLP
jgi:RNA polymerase sigma-70 factor, ECF subfamily